MKVSMMAAAVAALVAGGALAGCGGDKESHPASSASSASSSAASSSASPSSGSPTSSTPAAGDYSGLLLKPDDIDVPGDTWTLSQKPGTNPPGVEGVYVNQNNTRKIEISIYVYADTGESAQALDQNSKMIPELSTKATPEPTDVGDASVVAVGPSPDGAKAKGIVMFTQGKVFTVVELESAPDDPVSRDFILDLSQRQNDAIKTGMPH